LRKGLQAREEVRPKISELNSWNVHRRGEQLKKVGKVGESIVRKDHKKGNAFTRARPKIYEKELGHPRRSKKKKTQGKREGTREKQELGQNKRGYSLGKGGRI